VLALSAGSEQVAAAAEEVAAELDAGGLAVLLDDRDARPGEKFADADLLGCPRRVTVGKKTLEDGAVDARRRADGADTRVARGNLANWMEES
jgi:prolyl-tRNA synthetase